jgi:hypothetical protein
VTTRWHQLRAEIKASNLTAADKHLILSRIDHSSFGSAEMPAKWTRTQQQIAKETGLSLRQVQYSEAHLARHGWLRITGSTGPGRTRRYEFEFGEQCDCTGRVHEPAKTSTDATDAPERTQRAHRNGRNERTQRMASTDATQVPERTQRMASTDATRASERTQRTDATPQVNRRFPLRDIYEGKERKRDERKQAQSETQAGAPPPGREADLGHERSGGRRHGRHVPAAGGELHPSPRDARVAEADGRAGALRGDGRRELPGRLPGALTAQQPGGKPRPRPSGYLLRRIPKVVAAAPGGGLSRDELAAACRVTHAADEVFLVSLMVCYRRGQVDFVRDYVVAPARGSQHTEGKSS